MSIFISKMEPETFDALSPDFQLEIPNPRGKTDFRDPTPMPVPGDTLLIWVNGQGLVAEARIASVSPTQRPSVELCMFFEYPYPILADGWLVSNKGHAGTPPTSIAHTLGRSRGERGGTILLSPEEIAELDHERRVWLST